MIQASETARSRSEPLAFRAVRGGLWVAISSYSNTALGFLANLVLTRILAPEDFGVFALAQFFFALLNIRSKVGVGLALAQRQETNGELVGTHLALDLTGGLATVLVAALAMPVLHLLGYSSQVAWVVLALAGVGILDSLTATARVLLDKELRFGWTSLVNGVVFPLSYLPALWLALHGGGFWSLLVQNVVYAVLLLAGMWWAGLRQLPHILRLRWRFDRRVATEFLRFGAMIGLATVAGMLLTQFDNFLVGTFAGLATLGFYDRAYRIAQWPSLLVSNVLSRTAFYTYARLQDDRARLRRTVSMILWLITTLALPLALAIFVAAPDLVALLYGPRWLSSALFLRFLVAYSLLRPLLDNAGSLFAAVGRPQRSALVMAAQVAVLIVIATPLTIAFGVLGTCIGVGIAFALGLVLTYHYVHRTVDLPAREILAAPALAVALTLGSYLLLTHSLLDLNPLPVALRIVVKGGYAAGIFWLLTVLLQPADTLQRLRYVGRLLRHREAPPAGQERDTSPLPSMGEGPGVRGTLAIVSTDIRRDLVAPMRHFGRLRIVHHYRLAPYGDLSPADMDSSLVHYGNPWQLCRQLCRERPDIVQGVEPFSLRLLPYQALIYLYARLRRVPLIGGVHIGRPLREKYGLLPALALRILLWPYLRYTRLFFYLNEGGRRNLRWLGVSEARLVRHMYGTWGIDPDEFTPVCDGREPDWQGAPVLLFVGRIHVEKGIYDLLEAYGRALRTRPDLHLALIGDGPERAPLQELVLERGWQGQVQLLGTIKNRDLPPYLRAATLFVSPAISTPKWEEYVGMTNLQAMACGVPVISTRSGAIPEYVPEAAGVLVPERSPAALAEAIQCLLSDESSRRRLGAAGRAWAVAHYDARRNVVEAERIILERCTKGEPAP